jgi:hypothetical protein
MSENPMRGLITYLAAGAVVVLALDFIASPIGFRLPVKAWPAVEEGAVMQSVDRLHKADRLALPGPLAKRPNLTKPATVLVGCDPAFSPLSTSARANNFPGRCVA